MKVCSRRPSPPPQQGLLQRCLRGPVGVAIFALLLPLAAFSSEEPLPQTLESRQTPGAVWVSAEAASTPEGEIRWEAFSDTSRYFLENEVENLDRLRGERAALPKAVQTLPGSPYLPEELCGGSSVVFDHSEDAKPRDTLENLTRYAQGVFAGRVVEIGQGFLGGRPSSVLKLELEEVLKPSEAYSPGSYLLVAYPYAAFRIGDRVFCRREADFSYRPQVGDRLLLFPSGEAADIHHILARPSPRELIAEKASGGLYVSEKMPQRADLLARKNLRNIREAVEAIHARQVGEAGRKP